MPALRRETFPDFRPKEVEIRIPYPGATAEEVAETIAPLLVAAWLQLRRWLPTPHPLHARRTQWLAAAASDPGNADAMKSLVGAEGALSGALGKLNVVMEAYPDLKANQNMMQLSEELRSTENKVAFSRQAFNDSVTQYNTYKQTFPPVIFAGIFGHGQDAALLEFDSQAIGEPPKVSF